MNSVKHLSNLCYCVLLPCFSLLTHNACPTYSWFSECLLSPSKGCLMWPRRSPKVNNGWKRVQTVSNLVWWSLQKRWEVLTEEWGPMSANALQWETRTTFDTYDVLLSVIMKTCPLFQKTTTVKLQWLIWRSEGFRMPSADRLLPTTTSQSRCTFRIKPKDLNGAKDVDAACAR